MSLYSAAKSLYDGTVGEIQNVGQEAVGTVLSSLYDAIFNGTGTTQRSVIQPQGNTCDMGAIEEYEIL